jgi:hypothetical protein
VRIASFLVFAVIAIGGCVDSPADPIRLPAVVATATPAQRLVSTTGVEIVDLAPLAAGESGSASDVNDVNQIIVTRCDYAIGVCRQPAIWEDGSLSELMAPESAQRTFASRLNNRGEVVGNANFPPFGRTRAVLWAAGVPTVLPQLTPGSVDYATDINDDGTAVGTSAPPPPLPFLLRPAVWKSGAVTAWRCCSMIRLSSSRRLSRSAPPGQLPSPSTWPFVVMSNELF